MVSAIVEWITANEYTLSFLVGLVVVVVTYTGAIMGDLQDEKRRKR